MKPSFDLNELASLDSKELALARTKYTGRNQLAFSVMLKYFQLEGYYPTNEDFISVSLITCLASQLDINPKLLEGFNWQTTTAKRFRKEIREFLGYRKSTLADSKDLITWLIKHVLPDAPTLAQCYEKAYQFFHAHKLEPFAAKELRRYIRSATHRFEKQLFLHVFTQLSSSIKGSIEDLLKDDIAEFDQEDEVKTSSEIRLRHL